MSKIIEKSIYENINLLDDIKTDLESSISKASKQIIKSLNNGKKYFGVAMAERLS